MGFWNKFVKWLNSKPEQEKEIKKQEVIKKPTRRYIKDVKAGEFIKIEWSRIKNSNASGLGIGELKCINNDPETKKILLQVIWANYKENKLEEREKVIFDYDGIELKNFHLLNEIVEPKTPQKTDDDEHDIAKNLFKLQKQMNDALDKEEYREADELQKKIDKLLKK